MLGVLPRQLIADAITATAARIESGYGLEIKRREDRLRQALRASLVERAQVVEVRISPEWRPELRFWPWSTDGTKKLGGFDCAIRFAGDDSYSLVAELKWTHHGYVNALDEAIWDAFKLAQASATLAGVTHGLLVYLAPMKAWNKPPRFVELFRDSLTSTRSLITDHEAIWRWCLQEGSAARPTKLPPYLQTGPVAATALAIDGEPWELRAAVARANGEPWIDLDSEGMPIRRPNPRCSIGRTRSLGRAWSQTTPPMTSSGQTTRSKRSQANGSHQATYPRPPQRGTRSSSFAAHFNGYDHYGTEGIDGIANPARQHFDDYLQIDPNLNLDKLRGCLFFEYRRFHHFSHAPGADDTPYIRSLIEAIRGAATAQSG
jgi:hypothetical protein